MGTCQSTGALLLAETLKMRDNVDFNDWLQVFWLAKLAGEAQLSKLILSLASTVHGKPSVI